MEIRIKDQAKKLFTSNMQPYKLIHFQDAYLTTKNVNFIIMKKTTLNVGL